MLEYGHLSTHVTSCNEARVKRMDSKRPHGTLIVINVGRLLHLSRFDDAQTSIRMRGDGIAEIIGFVLFVCQRVDTLLTHRQNFR